MAVEILIGDIINDDSQTLVNTVNCVGIMGKGIALEFKEKFPEMFEDYRKRCAKKEVMPGVPYLYKNYYGSPVSIVNFPTKDHWRSASRIDDIKKGLDIFVNNYKKWNVRPVAFPPLGCGNGGLSWEDVGPLMYSKLSKLDIPVHIYAPYSTPKEQLKKSFLQQSKISHDLENGIIYRGKITPQKIMLLETLFRLEKMKYVSPVGRTIFQKINYMISESGIDLGFAFKQGTYGPYSEGAKNLIKEFSNNNLIVEEKAGRMIIIKTGSGYDKIREKYKQDIEENDQNIEKVVDLFSRIRNTTQAEEIATVYFVYCEIKKRKPYGKISEETIYEYVIDWKKYWSNEEKRRSIANAIRILTSLNWIDVTFSENLPIENYV
jgi:O-acetyl-ADP-ribose deacetylase (regulator of RNase III)/uncharacterized protein YwgA